MIQPEVVLHQSISPGPKVCVGGSVQRFRGNDMRQIKGLGLVA